VFNTDGKLLTHFAANAPGAGPLQNPWGIAQAPAHFGKYSNDLLIGNVAGAGNINVFDPTTGAYLGKLDQPDGTPIAIPGLWELEFGDGKHHGGKANQLFFDAGPNAPGVSGLGLFGVIRVAGDHDGDDDRMCEFAALGRGSLLVGVQPQLAMSQSPASAPGAPSASVAGRNMAVSPVVTPHGRPANEVIDHRALDQVFADLENTPSVALLPTADPVWTW
jgi:prepilin-type processing-associated H-X9-DG protein